MGSAELNPTGNQEPQTLHPQAPGYLWNQGLAQGEERGHGQDPDNTLPHPVQTGSVSTRDSWGFLSTYYVQVD